MGEMKNRFREYIVCGPDISTATCAHLENGEYFYNETVALPLYATHWKPRPNDVRRPDYYNRLEINRNKGERRFKPRPDVAREIRQFKEEYAKWVRWHAYYHHTSPMPAIEAAKFYASRGRRGFVCFDWEQATYKWAKEATKRYKYIGPPEERIWYLENFVTVPVIGGGHIILDPFLIGTPAPQTPW